LNHGGVSVRGQEKNDGVIRVLGLLGAVIVAIVIAGALQFNPASLVGSQQKKNDALIREQMAYHVGVLAYLYGYPLVDMHRQMHNETHRVASDQQVLAPLQTLDFFSIMNRVMKTLPRHPAEEALIAQFDQIGIGPDSDFDSSKLDDGTRAGLQRALVDGAAMVEASTQRTIASFNGWMISKDIGRYGYKYMHR
jgi:hypothetical protein